MSSPFVWAVSRDSSDQLALVDNADGLAFAAGDGLRGDQMDDRTDAEHGGDGRGERFFPLGDLAHRVGEFLRRLSFLKGCALCVHF